MCITAGLKPLSHVRRYSANAQQYFEEYLPGPKRTVFHTKKGLSWRNAWGVLRYSANNAFIAFVHADQMKKQASPSCPLSTCRQPCIMPAACCQRLLRHRESLTRLVAYHDSESSAGLVCAG